MIEKMHQSFGKLDFFYAIIVVRGNCVKYRFESFVILLLLSL
jgi:hypothetical protein